MSYRGYVLLDVLTWAPAREGLTEVSAIIARDWNGYQEMIGGISGIRVVDPNDKKTILKKAVDKFLNDKSCTLTVHTKMSVEECDKAPPLEKLNGKC